ncbi:MAG: efflux RND transporter periplasmic adaptor subunit [Proteobacteria bacterium]|nr:efflux RND transporter periplasmic adaptor subunit [Pseudomonadota bacterium]
MSKYKPLIVLVVVVLVIMLPFANRAFDRGDAKLVEIGMTSLRPIQPSILASGSLTHENEVNLSSEVIGRVTEVLVQEGQWVKKGELVLRIDDEAYVAQVEQNQAAVRLQEIDIERRKLSIDNLVRRHARSLKLYQQKLLDEDAFELAEHELEIARVDLEASRERLVQTGAMLQQFEDQLAKTRVLAPIDGVVTSLDIEVGETAITSTTNIPGSGLMTIADPASILTEVHVDEADVADVDLGQTAEIVAIAYPDQPLTGVVEFIANTAKIEQGRRSLSFLVKIRITDTNGIKLRPGMSCRAAIYTQSEDKVVSVPLRALITEEDSSSRAQNHYVFRDDNGIAVKTPVEIGLSDDEYQEIRSGVAAEVPIVLGPGRMLRRLNDGDAITGRGS